MMTIDNKSNDIETAVGSIDESTNDGARQPETEKQEERHPREAMFLGRWVLVDSKMSTPLVNFTSGEMIITRQINEKTGKVEYMSKTSWTLRFCCCCWSRGSNTSVTRYTSDNFKTFTITNLRKTLIDGDVEYGKMEGDNKWVTVGKKGTTSVEYLGDKCILKIIDARYSLYATLEYERVETFS